jgi:hypothetical protein
MAGKQSLRKWGENTIITEAIGFASLALAVWVIQSVAQGWAVKMSDEVLFGLRWQDIIGGGVVGGVFGSIIRGRTPPLWEVIWAIVFWRSVETLHAWVVLEGVLAGLFFGFTVVSRQFVFMQDLTLAAKMPSRHNFHILVQGLKHPFHLCREMAAKTLGEYGEREALEPLKRAFVEEKDDSIKQSIASAISKIEDPSIEVIQDKELGKLL